MRRAIVATTSAESKIGSRWSCQMRSTSKSKSGLDIRIEFQTLTSGQLSQQVMQSHGAVVVWRIGRHAVSRTFGKPLAWGRLAGSNCTRLIGGSHLQEPQAAACFFYLDTLYLVCDPITTQAESTTARVADGTVTIESSVHVHK